EARLVYAEADAQFRALRDGHPQDVLFQEALAESLYDRGLLDSQTGRLAEARQSYAEAQGRFEALRQPLRGLPNIGFYHEERARLRLRQAALDARRGDPAAAAREVEAAAEEVPQDGGFLTARPRCTPFAPSPPGGSPGRPGSTRIAPSRCSERPTRWGIS